MFPLASGWALKEAQKFGKKGAGKRMMNKVRILLKRYFLARNVNKSNHYTAQDMYQELQICVQEDEIDADKVPKLTTIQNWINWYSKERCEESARDKTSLPSQVNT
ncbi:19606_t:CDS:1 [Gigaspora margarita]|uniref:19606_t:CDS:1 n=1 Tax=Gigaspora margarita TaxID=4874 RepID=A0ABN7UM03_GIGMA|nr:19606_t:CDS:1 [Gigaspora margarita]